MGMDLCGKNREEWMSGSSWGCLLRLGLMYGWEPAGTEPPDPDLCDDDFDPDQWDRANYHSNDGQYVTAEDASALADALEQAIPDVPNHDAMAHKRNAKGGIEMDVQYSPFEWFSGDGKNHLVEIIAFLREGGFTIW